jgi:hypothetical protein
MNDDAAAHRTIRTGGTSFGGARDFEYLRLGVGFLKIKAEDGSDNGSAAYAKEIPTCGVHWSLLAKPTKLATSVAPDCCILRN